MCYNAAHASLARVFATSAIMYKPEAERPLPMPITPASTKDLPLPVRIFRTAMEQQRSLADYAQTLSISADSLHAIVTAQLDDVEPSALDRLADHYQQSRQTLREQFSITPPQESFADWLKRNMEGISQHALRTRAQLDAKTLKRFLNGEMLPDSDQAERLARALYIDRTELARVVTASLIHQADARRLVDRTDTSADHVMPAPDRIAEQGMLHPPRTRRQQAAFQAEQTSAEAPAANGATTTADTVRKPRIKPDADKTRRPPAGRQASTKTAAPASLPTTSSPIETMPAPALEHARPAADRQSGTKTTRANEVTPPGPGGAMVQRDHPPVEAAESDVGAAFAAPARPATRKRRRSGAVAASGATDAAAPAIPPREGEALASQDAVERDEATDSSPGAPAAAAVVAPPNALAVETDGTVSPDQNGPRRSTSDANPTPTTAPIPPANTPRPAPATTSTTTALESTAALAPSVVAADTTPLLLSADEVRLIRHWRRLHPHGRRATLHYIGSLLVED